MKILLQVDCYQVERFSRETKGHTRLRNPRKIARILAQDILDRYFSLEHFSGEDYERLFKI